MQSIIFIKTASRIGVAVPKHLKKTNKVRLNLKNQSKATNNEQKTNSFKLSVGKSHKNFQKIFLDNLKMGFSKNSNNHD